MYLGVHRVAREYRAVKVVERTASTDEMALRKETCIHRAMAHPGIIRFFDIFADTKAYYLVLEYASGGELFDRIGQSGAAASPPGGRRAR